MGKGSKDVYGLTSLKTLNLQWHVGVTYLHLGNNDKAQGYFKKIKIDSKYYLKYIELLAGLGVPYYEDVVRMFNPPFDQVPSYIWVHFLANYYEFDSQLEISPDQVLYEIDQFLYYDVSKREEDEEMYAKYMDFLRFTTENTLIYKAVLKFLESDEKKLVRVKDRRRRFEILTHILEERVAQMNQ